MGLSSSTEDIPHSEYLVAQATGQALKSRVWWEQARLLKVPNRMDDVGI